MPRTGLMNHVTASDLLVDEAAHECAYVGEKTAAVVAYVDYESTAVMQYRQNIVKRDLTYGRGE